MAGLLEFTAELPVFAVALAGVAAFLLGVGTRATTRPKRCARCRSTAARHCRRADRPAWLGWPGHHAGHLPYAYGDHLDPVWLDVDKLLARTATAPSDHTLATWITEDQPQSWPPLDVEGLMVERLLTEIEALDTREMEALGA